MRSKKIREEKRESVEGKTVELEGFVFCLGLAALRQDPRLDLSFWSFLTFLHHGIEEVKRHLL